MRERAREEDKLNLTIYRAKYIIPKHFLCSSNIERAADSLQPVEVYRIRYTYVLRILTVSLNWSECKHC